MSGDCGTSVKAGTPSPPHLRHMLRRGSWTGHRGACAEFFVFQLTGLPPKQTTQEGKWLEVCRWAGPRVSYWQKK